jgi:hypothetical protein
MRGFSAILIALILRVAVFINKMKGEQSFSECAVSQQWPTARPHDVAEWMSD